VRSVLLCSVLLREEKCPGSGYFIARGLVDWEGNGPEEKSRKTPRRSGRDTGRYCCIQTVANKKIAHRFGTGMVKKWQPFKHHQPFGHNQ
jgi:hypothetical protein